jgi:hypothetical protein
MNSLKSNVLCSIQVAKLAHVLALGMLLAALIQPVVGDGHHEASTSVAHNV